MKSGVSVNCNSSTDISFLRYRNPCLFSRFDSDTMMTIHLETKNIFETGSGNREGIRIEILKTVFDYFGNFIGR